MRLPGLLMVTDLNLSRYLFQKCKDLPPDEIIRRAFNKIKRYFIEKAKQWKDNRKQTYCDNRRINQLNQYAKPIPLDRLKPHIETIAALVKKYLDHQFDLLGSGWTKVYYGMNCAGIEGFRYTSDIINDNMSTRYWSNEKINSANRQFSKQVYRNVEKGYVPIDWQLDFKSGFRWSESTWFKHISYGDVAGADVKVPWELARMQHLPQLAFAFAAVKTSHHHFRDPNNYQTEFCNQVLDFIAHNPPRFGVNWACTMDVAIRVVNWLMAYDLFKAHGACFDRNFERYFFGSIYDHGKHIATHLEYSPILRGNHYLSDIAGLLYVSAYLPATSETSAWLAFAIKEFFYEVDTQFNQDGSNFEASTCYHRLSTEILIYSTALLRGIPDVRLNQAFKVLGNARFKLSKTNNYFPVGLNEQDLTAEINAFLQIIEKRIHHAIKFSMDMTGPDHQSVQIGDNDNGRFLKLQPATKRLKQLEKYNQFINLSSDSQPMNAEEYLIECSLDHRHLISAANGLSPGNEFRKAAGDNYYEECIVSGIANKIQDAFRMDRVTRNTRVMHAQADGLLNNINRTAYPNFGVYVYRSDNLYLVIRCGSLGQNGFGGHAHNDQLSIVLAVKDHYLLVDPGSYTYTNLPERRNEFRSTQMHNCLACSDFEQNDFVTHSLFELKEKTFSKMLSFEDNKFSAEHYAYGTPCKRIITLENMGLQIVDSCQAENLFLNLSIHANVHTTISNDKQSARFIFGSQQVTLAAENALISRHAGAYSDSYGWIRRNERLHISGFNRLIKWHLNLKRL